MCEFMINFMQQQQNDHLFLDSGLNPKDVCGVRNNIYTDLDWDIVRSYKEFVAYLEDQARDFPKLISFSHDLDIEHNMARDELKVLVERGEKANLINFYDRFLMKTGWHCARYLVTVCIKRGFDMPYCIVHSNNKWGEINILKALDEYEQVLNQTALNY